MSDKTLPRPPQATFCGGTILVGSVLIVLLAFGRMASLGSIEAQEEAQTFADSLGAGIGLSADDWQGVLRILCLIAGGLGVVTAYLGWRVLQRDRRSRLALSVLAPVALITGIAVADIIPAIMAVAVMLLWRPPTRQWFDGIAAEPRSRPTRAGAPDPFATGTGVGVGSGVGSTAPVAASPAGPLPTGDHAHQRPGTVLAAAVATIVTSALVILMLGVALLLILGDRAGFEREMQSELSSQAAYQDLDLDGGVLTDVFIGLLVVFLVWAVAAIALAVLTLRGSNGARITLVVSAFCAALASLLGVLVVVPLLVTAVCVAVAVLLLRRDAATWFAGRGHS